MDQMDAAQITAFLEKDKQRKLKQSLRFKRWRDAHPEVYKERNRQYKKKYAEQKKSAEKSEESE